MFELELKIEKDVKEIIENCDAPSKNIIMTYVIVDDDDVCNPKLYFATSRKAAIEVKKYFKNNYNDDVAIRPIVNDASFCFDFGGINPNALNAYYNYEKLLKTEGALVEKSFNNFSSVKDEDLPF